MTLGKGQMTKLQAIVEATNSVQGFAMHTQKNVQKLVDGGFVECNSAITEGDKLAIRATEKGINLVNTKAPETTEAPAAPAAPASSSNFAIDTGIDIPKATRGGGNRESRYPFHDLEVGQSFFVPATEGNENPAKALASTVSSAKKRYGSETGETRTINRLNKETGEKEATEVPVMEYSRDFTTRAVEEGGIKGARVWRTK